MAGKGSTRLTAERGVTLVKTIVQDELGWFLRRQEEPDIGIDGHIEVTDGGKETGQLLAVQVKAGASYVRRRQGDAIVASGEMDELEYWMRYKLPVIYVIADLDEQLAYWEAVAPDVIELTPRRWRMLVRKRLGADSAGELAELAYRGLAPFLARVSSRVLVDEIRRFALAEFNEELDARAVSQTVDLVTADGSDFAEGPSTAATPSIVRAQTDPVLLLSVAHVAAQRHLSNTLGLLLDLAGAPSAGWRIDAPPMTRLLHNLKAEQARYEGRYEDAVIEFEHAISISRTLERKRPLIIDLNDLGRVLRIIGRTGDSLSVLNEAFEVARSTYPWVHREIAVIADNLASTYRDTGDMTKALAHHVEALTIDTELFGARHPYVAIDHNDFAVTLGRIGAYDLARWNLQEARATFILHFGPNHSFVASVENSRAELALLEGRYDEAVRGFKTARTIRRRIGAAASLIALDEDGLSRTEAARQAKD